MVFFYQVKIGKLSSSVSNKCFSHHPGESDAWSIQLCQQEVFPISSWQQITSFPHRSQLRIYWKNNCVACTNSELCEQAYNRYIPYNSMIILCMKTMYWICYLYEEYKHRCTPRIGSISNLYHIETVNYNSLSWYIQHVNYSGTTCKFCANHYLRLLHNKSVWLIILCCTWNT